jgi:hypothetical protein
LVDFRIAHASFPKTLQENLEAGEGILGVVALD